MMDEHRCIGCRYCMAACPYGARRFNWLDPRLGLARVDPGFPTRTAGVVEKCTFCAERCRAGLEPLCVEASLRRGCNAIHFGLLEDAGSPVVLALRGRTVLRRRPELGTGPHVLYLV
jgi:molybdopterin-containing oxidoreductase family iron-sulfur binding subunit